MITKITYSKSSDALGIYTDNPYEDAMSLEGEPFISVDLPPDDGLSPVGLEVIGISGHLPLECNSNYCAETDTLTFGDMGEAPRVEFGDDLTAYWQPDPDSPDDFIVVAIDIRNASKHLAPAIAANQHKQTKPSQEYVKTPR